MLIIKKVRISKPGFLRKARTSRLSYLIWTYSKLSWILLFFKYFYIYAGAHLDAVTQEIELFSDLAGKNEDQCNSRSQKQPSPR